jgi:phosphoserine phosphatase
VQDFIATLIAAPGADLPADLARKAAAVLPEGRVERWLAEGEAADVAFSAAAGLDERGALERGFLATAAERVRQALGDARVDVVAQRAADRRRRLVLADMDSTMIGQECIDELADFVGMKAHVAAITERAMRGEIAFEPALRERVALLKGLEESVVDKVIAERITLTPGGRQLIQTMRANGAHTALVSGGFTLFTQKIAQKIGFHENRANVLEVEAGKFAGRVREPILGKEAKLASLIELREAHNLAHHETMAIGDGANDLAMLGEAGLGVAFHAKPAVAQAAHARIDHGDLSALLFAQGYARADFVN